MITSASTETQAAFLAAAKAMNTLALLALSDPGVDPLVGEGINDRQQWLAGCDWPILGYDTADPPAGNLDPIISADELGRAAITRFRAWQQALRGEVSGG